MNRAERRAAYRRARTAPVVRSRRKTAALAFTVGLLGSQAIFALMYLAIGVTK